MRVLFLTSAHNSLSQRLLIELGERGHEITVCIAATSEAMIAAAARVAPELILEPMLKIAIPEAVWSRHLCLIVHPGIIGDRGPSSLDWAIANNEKSWGVSILEAATEFDAGPIWASHEFALEENPPTKKQPVSNQVTGRGAQRSSKRGLGLNRASSGQVLGNHRSSQTSRPPGLAPAARPSAPADCRQADRAIDWGQDTTERIVRTIRAARQTLPGVLGELLGKSCFFYGAHEQERLKGLPGLILAARDGAICIGTVDGAVWISHLKAKDEARLGTAQPTRTGESMQRAIRFEDQVAGNAGLGIETHCVPDAPLPIDAPQNHRTFSQIVHREEGGGGGGGEDIYKPAMIFSNPLATCVSRLRGGGGGGGGGGDGLKICAPRGQPQRDRRK